MDKNKIIESAAKLAAKGAFDKAIKEYQKALAIDAKDVRVLQKIGELFQKKGDNVQAAQSFAKVAESYAGDGFFLKAVALYKQVLKLNPAQIEINIRLAELHQQLQLMSEAMAYYQLVVTHHEKAGNTKAAFDTLRKMIDLDPDNIASRIKLAELYARENLNKEAVAEFEKAAAYLQKHGRLDDHFRVIERLSTLKPDDVALALDVAVQCVKRGDHKRALGKLQICFKANPRDPQTLELLAECFEGLGQSNKTVSVYKELAKLHDEAGRRAEASKLWSRIEQLDPGDPDVMARRQTEQSQRSAPANQAPAAAVARPAAPSRPTAVAQPQEPIRPAAPASRPAAVPPSARPAPGAKSPVLVKLLTEADVYLKYGLHEKALEHLRKVFEADPENLDAHEKAYHIYVAAGQPAQAADQVVNVLRLCTRSSDHTRAQPYLAALAKAQPGHPELSAFMAALGTAGAASSEAVAELDEEAILVDSNDEDVVVSPAPPDALAGQTVESLNLRGPRRPLHADDDEPLDASIDDAGEEAAEEAIFVSDDDGQGEEEIIAVEESSEDESLGGAPVPDTDTALAAAASTHDETAVVDLDDDLLAVEAAGATDADDVGATTGAWQLPPPGEDAALEAAAAASDDAALQAAAADTEDETISDESPGELPAQEECDEASFFLDQGLVEEAREILETVQIAYPGHARAAELVERLEALEASAQPSDAGTEHATDGAALPAMPIVSAGAAESADDFDLARELADNFTPDAAADAPAAPDDFQYSVEEVFSEFKKGIEKVVKPEDVETHYDLGIAYKEMGLTDDAIGEFQVARQGSLGKKKELDCLTMIGMLQSAKGDHPAAVTAYKQALASPFATGQAATALRFDLAGVYEADGQLGRALGHLLEVQKQDPNHRGVGEAVERLSLATQPEDDTSTPPPGVGGAGGARAGAPEKGRKVGYV